MIANCILSALIDLITVENQSFFFFSMNIEKFGHFNTIKMILHSRNQFKLTFTNAISNGRINYNIKKKLRSSAFI